MNLRKKIKATIFFGWNSVFGGFAPKKAGILMYHSIGHNDIFETVRPEAFLEQMTYFYKQGYNIVSLDKLLEYFFLGNIPKKTIVLTFDDGCEDNFFNAFPILEKYKFSCTVFLATNFIGKEIPNSAGIPLKALTWDQIKKMHNSRLVDFQPHTVNHVRLSQVSPQETEREILQSKEIIEKQLNKKCRFFACPHGNYNSHTKEILERNKFEANFVSGEGLVSSKDNLFYLTRISINSDTDITQFRAKLNFPLGVLNFLRKI
jgi:peptidoglycan/xylan/chitin deacetylase (PgdA/CDA1 family)